MKIDDENLFTVIDVMNFNTNLQNKYIGNYRKSDCEGRVPALFALGSTPNLAYGRKAFSISQIM